MYLLKKSNNQIYIVDVDAKVVITLSQIDIDNLFDKYLEALAEKKYPVSKGGLMWMPSTDDITKANKQDAYLQAKKETPFSEQDLRSMYFAGLGMNNFDKALEELKLSKIPECGVEIEMEQTNNIPNTHYAVETLYKPKLTKGKVTITKLIL